FGLDAANAPTQHAQAVDHGGVGVGAYAAIWVSAQYAVDLAGHDGACQVLNVDLVHDAGAWWDDLEVVKRSLAPAQELVTLAVALVLDLHVALDGAFETEGVDLHGVVDNHFSRCQRVNAGWVTAEVLDGLAHGCQVNDTRHTGEVLHQHTCRGELDFGVRLSRCIPLTQCIDVLVSYVRAVFGAKQVLKKNLKAVRKAVRAFNRI